MTKIPHKVTNFNNGNQSEARFALPSSPLHRLLNECAYYPRCSDDKSAKWVKPREAAIKYPYMQINRPGFVSWMIFDLDHADPFIFETAGLPAPNIIVSNPANGSSHLFYAISPVCTSDAARDKPQQYLRAIYAEMAERLQADADYHGGPVAKTPGHRWWRTLELHNRQYDLADFLEFFDLPRMFLVRKKSDANSHSRHCMLFDTVRYYAYSIVSHYKANSGYDQFLRVVRSYAEANNRFKNKGFMADLPGSSIRATIRSICRWTWTKYRGQGAVNRGVMALPENMPLKVKQQKAAERTHTVRKDKTAARIKQSIAALVAAGHQISQALVARATGLSRQTIAKFNDLLNPEPQSPSIESVHVNYAVHQITGERGFLTGDDVGGFVCSLVSLSCGVADDG